MGNTILGTDRNDQLSTTGVGDTLLGLGGDDVLSNSGSDAVLIGGTGNDLYRLYQPGAQIFEDLDGGHDTIWAWRSITMPDNVEDLVFKGTFNWQSIRGNELDNSILSGAGTQALDGGGGNDTLKGGAGVDTFTFEPGDGNDRILDFTPGTDKITIWHPDFKAFSDVLSHATTVGNDVRIDVEPGQTITLANVSRDALTAADFGLETSIADVVATGVLSFEDNFDDASSVTSGRWNTTPTFGHPSIYNDFPGREGREQAYLDANSTLPDGTAVGIDPFSVNNGVLSITARRLPTDLAAALDNEWSSGQLDTHGTFEQTYGYFEMRAKMPAGQGYWPAFWLSSPDYSWPPEIDIAEVLGGATDSYSSGVHSAIWGSHVVSSDMEAVPNVAAKFHTYGMLWTPEAITFTFDGRVIHRIATPETLHGPMAIELNLAMGGWAGATNASTPDGQSFDIDYVRAYQIPGIDQLPPSTASADFGDEYTGVLNTGAHQVTNLYGDVVYRAVDSAEPDLALLPGQLATLVGDGRDNHLSGNDEANVLNGAEANDTLTGAGGTDYLIGGAGDDVLDGGTGGDTLVGGAGDDLYILRRGDGSASRANDMIIEQPGEGTDTVYFVDLLPSDIKSYIDWARWHVVVDGPNGPEYFAVKVTPGIGGHHLDDAIERIIFADGTVWDTSQGVYLSGDDTDNRNSGTRGDDTVLGAGGNDTVIGMDGDDRVDGGAGTDLAYGWNGNDYVTDTGIGNADTLNGEAGDDTVVGGSGGDLLFGGDGNDSLTAFQDGTRLNGDAGDDTLLGGAGADALSGGDGIDSIDGGAGADLSSGGDGNDVMTDSGGGDVDSLNGGAGNDTIAAGAGRDILSGGADADSLTAFNDGSNLSGDDGNDVLVGKAGADTLSGGADNDTIDGAAGADAIYGDDGNDTLADTGRGDVDTLNGGAGDDAIVGGAGGDVLFGGDGNDHLQGYSDGSELHGGDGDDELIGKNGADKLFGDAGNDRVRAGGGANLVDGGDGNDSLSTGGGNDTIYGGTGKDAMVGGAGLDVLLGNDGDDKLSGGSGDDTLNGGAGKDKYAGGSGVDDFHFLFPEIEGDSITDFAAGELIAIGVDGDAADAAVTLNGSKFTISHHGAKASFTAAGASLADIIIVHVDAATDVFGW